MASLAKTFPWLESCLGRLTIFLELPPLCYIHAYVSMLQDILNLAFFSWWKNKIPPQNVQLKDFIMKQIRRGKRAQRHFYNLKSTSVHTWRHICFFLSAPENIIHNNQIYMKYLIVSSLSNSLSVHMLKKARTANSAQTSPVCTMAAVNQEATKSR